MRTGKPSPKYGHRGVWFHSTGPNGPVPGDRLRVVIYDQNDQIVRRFEQIQGTCIDDGYTDFFGSSRCRPAKYLMPLVDIAPDGTQTVLFWHVAPETSPHVISVTLQEWVERHGIAA